MTRPAEPDDTPLPGWHRLLDGNVPAALYRDGERRFVRLGAVTREITVPGQVVWQRQDNGMARLTLLDGDGVIAASVVYFGGDVWGVPPEWDFTGFREPEDDDFGEFIHRRLAAVGLAPSGPAVPDAVAVLGAPVRERDLGPLADAVVADYAAMPLACDLDRRIRAYVLRREPAPEPPGELPPRAPSGFPVVDPPVIAVALAFTDSHRAVLREFALRMARFATERGDASVLPVATIAATLGGLDCAPNSGSIRAAKVAIDAVGAAATALGADLARMTAPARARVGQVGRIRLEAWQTVFEETLG